jgi:hypothetical protein
MFVAQVSPDNTFSKQIHAKTPRGSLFHFSCSNHAEVIDNAQGAQDAKQKQDEIFKVVISLSVMTRIIGLSWIETWN